MAYQHNLAENESLNRNSNSEKNKCFTKVTLNLTMQLWYKCTETIDYYAKRKFTAY